MRKLAADSYRILFALGLLVWGVVFVAYGLWLVWEPAAWIFVGGALGAGGLLIELDPRKKPRR
jgi:hypothetical protein